MAHPAYLREKARELRRKKKLTIDELGERLALPRTTIYYWVRDIAIPRTRYQSLAQSRAARSNRASFQALRDAAYDEGVLTYAFFHVVRCSGTLSVST
jgi:transcriptional regulator with XRE-family HTH domain